MVKMSTLSKIISSKSNDYSELEERFNKTTGDKLVGSNLTNDSQYNPVKKSYSVIIPSYGLEKYLVGLLLSLDNQQFGRKFEVIIVNDSKDTLPQNIISFKSDKYETTIVNLGRNYGRAIARNAGLSNAKGEIISFIDSDMILPHNYIREHYLRVALLPNIALAGFYQNTDTVEYDNLIQRVKRSNFVFNADFRTDSRYEKIFTESDLRFGYNVSESDIGKRYTPLEATNSFKSFGFGVKYGTWDLPMMALAGLLTVSKEMATSTGGFDTRFKGWGFEDVHFSAKLIASGAYIVPFYHVVPYRITHSLREGTSTQKSEEGKNNYSLYKRLLREPFGE